MAKWETKRERRKEQELQRHVADLEEEKRKLEVIRDCKPLWDAVNFYLGRVPLTAPEQSELRTALRYLTRG